MKTATASIQGWPLMEWPVEGFFFAPYCPLFEIPERAKQRGLASFTKEHPSTPPFFPAEDRGKNGEFFLPADVKEWAFEYVTVQIRRGPSTNKSLICNPRKRLISGWRSRCFQLLNIIRRNKKSKLQDCFVATFLIPKRDRIRKETLHHYGRDASKNIWNKKTQVNQGGKSTEIWLWRETWCILNLQGGPPTSYKP